MYIHVIWQRTLRLREPDDLLELIVEPAPALVPKPLGDDLRLRRLPEWDDFAPLGVAGIVYRRYFLGLPKERQYDAVKRVFDYWFPWVWRFRESKLMQFALSRLNPIVNYYPHFGLRDREMYYEWMLLDTHDAMTDVFKHRRTPARIAATLEALGGVRIAVSKGGNGVEAYAEKPAKDGQA